MFETELILRLQAAGSPPLTWLLSFVSLLGYPLTYVVLLVVLGFGVRVRPSLAVLATTLLAAVLFDGAKAGFALPRPQDIDSRVRSGVRGSSVALVERGGAPDFWSLPRPEAIAAVRARAPHDYGFPSGHVAAATAFLLGFARHFRSRRTLAFAALWLPLMALSRMYLGRHFLADVLGGLVVGLLAAALAVPAVRLLEEAAFERRSRRGFWLLVLLAAGLLGAAVVVRFLPPLYLGGLAGLVLGYAFLSLSGPPPEGGSERQRALRVAVAGLVCGLGLLAFAGPLAHREERLGALVAGLTLTTTTLVGPVVVARRLRLHG